MPDAAVRRGSISPAPASRSSPRRPPGDRTGASSVLKGLGNLANLPGLIKQAQEMGSKMQQLSAELKTKQVTGSAGGGLVEVDANGLGEALAVRIDPSLFEKHDRELLEDLLPAAFNAAQQKAKELHAEQMQSLAGGMNIPGLSRRLGRFRQHAAAGIGCRG